MRPNVKSADGIEPPLILQDVIVYPIQRKKQDILDWRNANRIAESLWPRRVLLYDLYEDVILDGHVIAVTGKRRDAVTNAKWEFVDKDGLPVDEVNNFIDSIAFEELLKFIHDSKNWGYSMVICRLRKNEEGLWELFVDLVPRKHMRPERGMITYQQTGDDGFFIRDGFYTSEILEAGNPKDLGLFLGAAQYAIYKRGGFGDFATFVEVFGQGIIDATWDGFDEKQRQKLSDAITGIGNGGVILRPGGTEVKMLENKTNSDGKLHGGFIDKLNAEISKALLGTTETTESSSSSGYAQSETHQDDDDEKKQSDINYVRRVLNARFIKILKAQGVDTKGGKFIVAQEKASLSPKEKVDTANVMANQLGMPIDHDDLYESTGVKKPDDYEQQLAAKKAEQQQQQQKENPGNNDKPAKAKENDEEQPDKPAGKISKLRLLYQEYKNLTNFFG